MKRGPLLAGVALLLCSSLVVAQDAPESLLPPGFDEPAPSPPPGRPSAVPAQSPSRPAAAAPAPTAVPGGETGSVTAPASPAASAITLPDKLPSIDEIEKMSVDEIDELLGLRPKFDIPPEAQRALNETGVIGQQEGGFAPRAVAGQPASLIRAALQGTKGPLVSRWGHILLRRALASRLDAPTDMSPVEFAALRAGVLNRLGESTVARALVQDVDTNHYTPALIDAAFDAYLATGDVVGMCPAARLHATIRKDAQWQMIRSICAAFAGEGARGGDELNRALSRGLAPRIDVLLAQRFAGAAGTGRRAVNIEWNGVDDLSPWRFGLATALGLEIPAGLLADASPYYDRATVAVPAIALPRRIEAADRAAADGILSSAAMVDLYGQVFADNEIAGKAAQRAQRLHDAYVAADPAARLAAMRELWGTGPNPVYGRQVLTAYAAARMPVSDKQADGADGLIASMLSAGLDRNALRWGSVVEEGSLAWAMLALAQPDRRNPVSTGAIESFIGNDGSEEGRKARFLVAGLAGLGRVKTGDLAALSSDLGLNLGRQTRWSRMIDKAAQLRNPALVALLAGLGMQGDGWNRMTPRHLYHIVSALDRAGLQAEARMIAAEAVARG